MDQQVLAGLAGSVGAMVLFLLSLRAALRSRTVRISRRRRTDAVEPVVDLRDAIQELAGRNILLTRDNDRLIRENNELRRRILDAETHLDKLNLLPHYWALGLDPGAPIDAVSLRRAYVAAVKTAHPDTGGSAAAFARVEAAYAALKGTIAPLRA
jgi:hypothetical protein